MDTSASSDLLARVAGSAAAQFDAAGGCVLPPSAPTTRAARDAFVLVQQAAAHDVAAPRRSARSHALNNSGAQQQPPPPEPAPLAGHKKRAADDESDGNALQGELVAAHVRAGKTIETLDPGAAHAAPDGSLRLVQPGFLGEEACPLVAAGVVAMAGAFSRCGQTTLGTSPALARARARAAAGGGRQPRARAVPDGRARPPPRRRRLRRRRRRPPRERRDDGGAAAARRRRRRGGGVAAAAATWPARAAGALDVGALRGDHFVYWRPHVDQVSVPDYDYSALLYLTRHGDHFEGGRLIFHDGDADRRVEPTPGLLVAFASGAANLHAVTRVTRGVRFALTMWFSLQPPAAAAPAEHSELQRARDAFDAELAGAPPPPPPPPPPAAADGASADGKGGCAVASRDAELASAALCSLPANEPLCQALVLARQAHGGGGLVHTLARGVGVGVEEAHCAPRAEGDDGGPPPTARRRCARAARSMRSRRRARRGRSRRCARAPTRSAALATNRSRSGRSTRARVRAAHGSRRSTASSAGECPRGGGGGAGCV